jgi:hypothetical protein
MRHLRWVALGPRFGGFFSSNSFHRDLTCLPDGTGDKVMLGRTLAALCLAQVIACGAFAQSNSAQTINTTFEQVTSGGKRLGCTLVFTAIAEDHGYRQGGMISLNGHVGIMRSGDRIAATLKVVLHDLNLVRTGVQREPSAPAFAYLRSPNGQSNAGSLIDSQPSDTPGGLFLIYPIDEPFGDIVLGILEQNRVDVVYNRRDGGIDVTVPIDLSVQDVASDGTIKRSDEPVQNWVKCSTELASELEAELSR